MRRLIVIIQIMWTRGLGFIRYGDDFMFVYF